MSDSLSRQSWRLPRRRFYCGSCGMVVWGRETPWCRHNDGDRGLPAARMAPLPYWHPMAKETT